MNIFLNFAYGFNFSGFCVNTVLVNLKLCPLVNSSCSNKTALIMMCFLIYRRSTGAALMWIKWKQDKKWQQSCPHFSFLILLPFTLNWSCTIAPPMIKKMHRKKRNPNLEIVVLFVFRATMNIGAVAALRNIKSAISVARHVLENTQHSIIVGSQATEFAEKMGFKKESLTTNDSKVMWESWKADNCQPNFWMVSISHVSLYRLSVFSFSKITLEGYCYFNFSYRIQLTT